MIDKKLIIGMLVSIVLVCFLIIPVSAADSGLSKSDISQYYAPEYVDYVDEWIMDVNDFEMTIIGIPTELDVNVLKNKYKNTLKLSISLTGLPNDWERKIYVELFPLESTYANGDNLLAYPVSMRESVMMLEKGKNKSLFSPINSYYCTKYTVTSSRSNSMGNIDVDATINLELNNAIATYAADNQKDFLLIISVNDGAPIFTKKIKVINSNQETSSTQQTNTQSQKTPFPLIGVLTGMCIVPLFLLNRRK